MRRLPSIGCSDKDTCTIDTCDPVLGAVHTPDDSLCAAGEYCNPTAGCLPRPVVATCEINFPQTLDALAGQQTADVIGWIWVPGVTESPGQGAGIVADVGYGAPGSDPGLAYTWFAASWDHDAYNGVSDAYAGSMLAPSVAGTYDYLYRVSLDARASYTYCDVLGIYDPASPLPGVMTVH